MFKGATAQQRVQMTSDISNYGSQIQVLAGRRVTAIRYFTAIEPARLQDHIIDLMRLKKI